MKSSPARSRSQFFAIAVDGYVDVDEDIVVAATADANDSSFEVEEGAARIAAHDLAVGEDHIASVSQDAPQADYRRLVTLEGDGVAECDTPLALFEIVGGSHFCVGPGAFSVELDHAGIDSGVVAESMAADASAIRESDRDSSPFSFADMSDGEHEPVFADDDAASAGDADDARSNFPGHGLNLPLQCLEFDKGCWGRSVLRLGSGSGCDR